MTTQSKRTEVQLDDLFPSSPTEAITETDAELERVVDGAELPVLLASIAAATGDLSWLGVGLEPPHPPADLTPCPHGGMTEDQQAQARKLALAGLRELAERRITTVSVLPPEHVDAILGYLTGGREEWHPSLKHELNLAPDKGGAPDWRFADLAGDRDYSVLIVGAGVGGIAAAHRFSQAGVPITVVESAAELGGTWAKNRYPGVRLDTPTFGYSYSFAQRGDWPHQFAEGHEILEYLRDVAVRAGLTDKIEFSTTLVRARWSDADGRWHVTTRDSAGVERERTFSAIVSAVGQLDRPNIPDFAGAEDFRGVTMHTQEWRDDVDWTGARVAVIGTGASAYQIVPAAIADGVGELVLFQRSAPWMLPAPTYHDKVTEAFSWLRRKVPHYAQWYRLWVILLGIPGRTHSVTAEEGWPGAPLSVSARNQAVRDELVRRLSAQLEGRPDLLAHAIPDYPPGAKRMLRDNGVWAAALRSSRTTLVTSGIDHFTPRGIVDGDGVEHVVDIVVFATGFKPSDYLEGIEVIGRGGLELHEYWAGDARAHACVTVPGFPSFFMIYGPNIGGVSAGSLHFMLERAAEYAVKAVRRVLEEGAAAIDVLPAALDRFVAWVDRGNRRMSWGQPYVRSWYKNSHGRVSQIWPYTNADYWDVTETVRDEDHVFLR
ncbi:flavin-containing monooxygenase [Amycolatopsis thermophila]|uniref:4-hydroxyacetophenone monooxygenase n=1 Tax=Amycolatopsis thermophila TaxID=206084 RepID=A0ABU0EYB6_9PSEU|nr:NAD(P)/FAD-dependent oxidoreductase [Amycolatopsis thermophila]MDQ0380312.1 4-hydroxyacetophenone monooxygenase [Amycolatopsis thermophila]